jgi:hypothetical protein
MRELRKVREFVDRVLVRYEHIKTVLELLGLDWRDVRDAALAAAALAPVIRLQDLPIQWFGLSLLGMFALSLAIIFFVVRIWKDVTGPHAESPRSVLLRGFRRFLNVALTIGLAVSWYDAGRHNDVTLIRIPTFAPVNVGVPAASTTPPLIQTTGSSQPLRNTLSSTDKDALGKILIRTLDVIQKGESAAKQIEFDRGFGEIGSLRYMIASLDKGIAELEVVDGDITEIISGGTYQYYSDDLAPTGFSDREPLKREPCKKLIATALELRGLLIGVASLVERNTASENGYPFNDIGRNLIIPTMKARNDFLEWLENCRGASLKQQKSLR